MAAQNKLRATTASETAARLASREKMPGDFMPQLYTSQLKRPPEAGTAAFTIVRLARCSSNAMSYCYARFVSKLVEAAFNRTEMLSPDGAKGMERR